ncbi:hypothetical protein E4U41_001824 [Claviceps citrina]|nr:hypothetical protein E4U41_001824 [Claviceps citrina]
MSDGACTEPSSVLFQSEDQAVVLLDVPRSLEEAQVLPGDRPPRRILSASPPGAPFPTPDPRTGTGTGKSRRRASSSLSADSHAGAAAHHWPAQSPAAQIADLMTTASVEAALRLLADTYHGPFHLPRLASPPEQQLCGDDEASSSPSTSPPRSTIPVRDATPLHGSIQALRDTFHDRAPLFDLIVLDPPWPNRSARRRTGAYAPASTLADVRSLLTSIPIAQHLASGGLVAVWITNKASIPELLTSPGGVFASWGVELAAEWTWLKITARGEPMYDPASAWRKPWERILVAKRVGAPTPPRLGPRVIVAAPDVHSRKPNLRGLFGHVFRDARYRGLEIFARNLTAGWWSWGDQVLHFQDRRYWTQNV